MARLQPLIHDLCVSMQRILIAEDDGALRDALREALVAQGFDVQVVTTAHEACDIASHEQFDAVLSDICMPDNGDGARLVQRLSHVAPETPIILMTAFDQPGGRERALAEGAVDYLLKPIRLERLRAAIDRALARNST